MGLSVKSKRMRSDVTLPHLVQALQCSPSSIYTGNHTVSLEDELKRVMPLLRELLDHIESPALSSAVYAENNMAVFKDILDRDPQVQKLVELCRADRPISIFLIGHMLDLSIRKDSKYKNYSEVALTAYLYIITTARVDLNKSAIAVCHNAKNASLAHEYISTYLS